MLTSKLGLILTRMFINYLTGRTTLRTVTGIYKFNTHSHSESFVVDKLLKLSKAPVGHGPALPSAETFDPLSDMGQIFQCHYITRSTTRYQLLTHAVVHVSLKPCQSARQLFKMSFGRLRAFSLERTAEF